MRIYKHQNELLTNSFIDYHLISTLLTTRAAIFEIRYNCPYTVWAAASPGGVVNSIDRYDVWWLYVAPGTQMARIWGRTGCYFDDSGEGSCRTGDCGGLTCTIGAHHQIH